MGEEKEALGGRLSAIADNLSRSADAVIASGAAITVFSGASLALAEPVANSTVAGESRPAEKNIKNISDGQISYEGQTYSVGLKSAEEIKAIQARRKSKDKRKQECVTGRLLEDYIYMSYGCKADGDTFNSLPGENSKYGWVEGIMVVDGIYKCVMSKKGILPKRKGIAAKYFSRCSNYFQEIRQDPGRLMPSRNCDRIKSKYDSGELGVWDDPCVDATQKKQETTQYCLSSPNKIRARTYRNFSTKRASVLNMRGSKKTGFSGVIKANRKGKFQYRSTFYAGDGIYKAMVVRAPIWGWQREACSNENNKKQMESDGTLKENLKKAR